MERQVRRSSRPVFRYQDAGSVCFQKRHASANESSLILSGKDVLHFTPVQLLAQLQPSPFSQGLLVDSSNRDKMSGPSVVTRGRARLLKQSFRNFPDLPPELRCRIWQEALPDHGIYPVDCLQTSPASDATQTTIQLQLLPRHRWSREFVDRVRTIEALLEVCEESRHETQLRFPHALPHPDGEMRFNGYKDVFFIASSLQLTDIFINNGSETTASQLTFAHNWNRLVRKLAFQTDVQESMIGFAAIRIPNMGPGLLQLVTEYMAGFVHFLMKFERLKQLFLVGMFGVPVQAWNKTPKNTRLRFQQVLRRSYPSGLPQSFRDGVFVGFDRLDINHLSNFTWFLKRIIHGNPDSQVNNPLSHAIKFGYPELQGIDILNM